MKRAFLFLLSTAAAATALAPTPHRGGDLEYALACFLAVWAGWGMAGEFYVQPRLRRRLHAAEDHVRNLQEERFQLRGRLARLDQALVAGTGRPLYPPHTVMDYCPIVRAKLPV